MPYESIDESSEVIKPASHHQGNYQASFESRYTRHYILEDARIRSGLQGLSWTSPSCASTASLYSILICNNCCLPEALVADPTNLRRNRAIWMPALNIKKPNTHILIEHTEHGAKPVRYENLTSMLSNRLQCLCQTGSYVDWSMNKRDYIYMR